MSSDNIYSIIFGESFSDEPTPVVSSETVPKKFHYVYRITNVVEKKYYYGAHSCDDLEKERVGVKYFSSSTDKEFLSDQKENPSHYRYKILRFFDTREEAVALEIFLHAKFDVKKHLKFYNMSNQTSTGFDTTGKVVVKDKEGNCHLVPMDDARIASGELTHLAVNRVTVRDENGDTFSVYRDDEEYISGELVGATKGYTHSIEACKRMSTFREGKILVRAVNGDAIYLSKEDERVISGELTHINKGKIRVKDQDGNNYSVSLDDPKYLSGEFVHNRAGLFPAKDSDGNVFDVSFDDPRVISGELVGVHKGRVPVRDKDGKMFSVSVDDERYISGELEHVASGHVMVRDSDGNTMSVLKTDPRYVSGELVGITKGKFKAKDKDGNKFFIDRDDPRFLSGELVGASKGAKQSPEVIAESAASRVGSKRSDETKRKMRESNSKKKSVSVEGIIYESISEARRQIGISVDIISYRCESKREKYKNYFFINNNND